MIYIFLIIGVYTKKGVTLGKKKHCGLSGFMCRYCFCPGIVSFTVIKQNTKEEW